MKKNLLFNLIVIRVIYIILAIVVPAIVAGIIAAIAIQFTEDIESIVIFCLCGVWISEVILYIARCKITYNKRIKAIDEDSAFLIIKKKNNLIKLYVVFSTVFAVVFGFILYNMKDSIVNNIIGGTGNYKTESINENWLMIKIGTVIILLVVLFVRLGVRKRYKDKMASEKEKQSF